MAQDWPATRTEKDLEILLLRHGILGSPDDCENQNTSDNSFEH
jgi:hypothetical protein